MASVTTTQAINDKILSMDYNEFRAEIKTVDAQESLEGGVNVLVTGYLTGKDNAPRNFTQSFFLATQDKGYYVLNDMFRYVEVVPAAAAVASHSPELETTPPPQTQLIKEPSVVPEEEEEAEEDEVDDEEIDEELYNPSEDEEELVKEVEVPVEEVIDEAPDSSPPVATDSSSPAAAAVQEDTPKKSYASILKVMRESASPLPAPSPPARTTPPANTERQASPAPTPASAPEAPVANSNSTETSSVQEGEADSHSVYIKNLPLTATPTQLEDEFKKFGSIKPNGIQVRSHKQQGFCFGFVEFEAANAVQSAIEASPIIIGGRQAYVEEKRPAGSRVSNRGRFLPGRGGFWNDGGRGRGSYGGRGNGRVEYNNRPDFGGRGSVRVGAPNRGADGIYQRVDSTGSTGGRGNRPGSMATTAPRNYTPREPAPASEMN